MANFLSDREKERDEQKKLAQERKQLLFAYGDETALEVRSYFHSRPSTSVKVEVKFENFVIQISANDEVVIKAEVIAEDCFNVEVSGKAKRLSVSRKEVADAILDEFGR